MQQHIDQFAETLDNAARNATAVPQLTPPDGFGIDHAYAVQHASIARRVARGERVIGYKMGFTSRAKMAQMGVSDMIWGHLTDAMLVEDGAPIALDRYVHPRVEPEVAFLIGRTLSGPVTPLQALAAVEGVAPALEIIDSRYADFRFNLLDVVADNSSSSSFVTGAFHYPGDDLSNLGIVLSFDGQPVAIGSSAAILGDPLRALAAASRLVGEHGLALEPGMIVLAGAATAAHALRPGVAVSVEFETLGRCGFRA
jgi:2-oxo-3-hexenedioate decarboxylase